MVDAEYLTNTKRNSTLTDIPLRHIVLHVLYIIEAGGSMAEIEHPEKYNWWLNELDSLGISTLEKSGLNNRQEASDLTDAVNQTLYEEYIQAYNEK
jgi:hypothetical protein